MKLKRPPFDRRIPIIIVMLGTLSVLLTLGGLNLSLRGLPDPTISEPGEPTRNFPTEERAAEGFSWDLHLSIEGGRVEARLRDPQGEPVSGGQGLLTLAPGGQEPRDLPMREAAPGLYVADLPRDLAAPVQARIRIARGAAHIARGVLITF
ncbi:FixH family protein [Geoalkalibacter halelectricus]|uniref:FixH family protein n=1 Tax=Geoalkalibacter halelectricus TaxID=2847045 RepID=A0ABY5ZPG1_9BACT|nr:FixH family protein [Geoalkalibacter halelectricus]MDO3379255.1 FixH family protein [Geoalkalibacter halelectricus]UWZ81013.1 FixH family protein [Geoalkalibacter halelectricus]